MYLYVSVCVYALQSFFGERMAEQHAFINISSMTNHNFSHKLHLFEIKIYVLYLQ